VEAVEQALASIRARNGAINAFTAVLEDRARGKEKTARGPLKGIPFAVKNLFDVKGLSTLAGSKINRDLPPAARDAPLIERLEAAGAVLVGTLNMDEYAYGFSTENTHYGPTRNPRNLEHVAGGSSGGSAAAVAADMVPLTLGSDTNGSIRVPASFCGVWGLKPTFGRLTREGSFPFVNSLDHVGPLAANVDLLAAAYDVMQDAEPVSGLKGIEGLRIARAVGYFEENAEQSVVDVIRAACKKLQVTKEIEIPAAALGRAAAFVITASEGGQLHLPNLRKRPDDFEPMIVERLMAGALMPAAWYLQAQRVRRWYYRQVLKLFEEVDVILAPATPRPAQKIGQETFTIRGKEMLARPNAGLLTQPISCIGLPVICAPVGEVENLPVGMQIIAAPWREDHCFRVARALA
jgi:AtzE family amidohydrolase